MNENEESVIHTERKSKDIDSLSFLFVNQATITHTHTHTLHIDERLLFVLPFVCHTTVEKSGGRVLTRQFRTVWIEFRNCTFNS